MVLLFVVCVGVWCFGAVSFFVCFVLPGIAYGQELDVSGSMLSFDTPNEEA